MASRHANWAGVSGLTVCRTRSRFWWPPRVSLPRRLQSPPPQRTRLTKRQVLLFYRHRFFIRPDYIVVVCVVFMGFPWFTPVQKTKVNFDQHWLLYANSVHSPIRLFLAFSAGAAPCAAQQDNGISQCGVFSGPKALDFDAAASWVLMDFKEATSRLVTSAPWRQRRATRARSARWRWRRLTGRRPTPARC